MKTRKELLEEYEQVRLYEPETDIAFLERLAALHVLQWIIWGTTDSPSKWLAYEKTREI